MERHGFNLMDHCLMRDFFGLFCELLPLPKEDKKLLGQLQHTPNTPSALILQVFVTFKWFTEGFLHLGFMDRS